MSTYSQAGRPMRISTALGGDVLLLAGFRGDEGISTPFHFALDLLSENPNIKGAQLLGTPAAVTVELPDRGERILHGRINRFTQLGRALDVAAYRAELVPWLWFLSLSSNCRIFQNLSPLDIAERIFKSHNYSDFEIQCKGSYAPRTYCVQYRETDLDFVSRLLEEEGIFYFFKHSADKHVLVLADQASAIAPCPEQATATVVTTTGPRPSALGVLAFETEDAVHTEKVTLDDYDFEQPSLGLRVTVAGQGNGEIYDYPGHYTSDMAGDRYARLRLEAVETWGAVARGTSTYPAFTSGTRFDLKEHFRSDANQTYTLVSLHHAGRAPGFLTGESPEVTYENTFVAVPYSVVFRPPRTVPRPHVGAQTALVVGPAGEEIYVDKYGRVKVQFYWDRDGKKDENSSCWMRVSTAWAGKAWGTIHLPRIGQEVIVEFLDGDPDCPIITGRVYNATQMPPYTLPANSTQSGVKSRSSKGGGSSDSNELRFEDKTGSEEIYLHAQKDLNAVVGHDESWTVANDRTTTIKHNDSRTVQNDDSLTVQQGDQTVQITAGSQKITISAGDQTTTLDKGDQSIELGTGSQKIHLGEGDQTLDLASGDQTITLGQGSQKIDITAGDQTVTLGEGSQKINLSAGDLTTTLGAGNYTTKVEVGQISQEAMQGLELKVGENSIKIDQTGITIKGLMITIQADVQTDVKGAMTSVGGDGMLTLKGGITMIN
jgi:type VI secretion system secreted protein VgrG